MIATEHVYIACEASSRAFGEMPTFGTADLRRGVQPLPDRFLLLDTGENVRGCAARADAGELLIIDCRTQPFPGDMVLARIQNDFCVMRVWVDGGHLWLEEGQRPEVRFRIEPGRGGCEVFGIVYGTARACLCPY